MAFICGEQACLARPALSRPALFQDLDVPVMDVQKKFLNGRQSHSFEYRWCTATGPFMRVI
jgi:hypothetical protein